MNVFWEIVVSNALLVVVLAVGAAVVGRFWKNPQGLYVLWLLVLLKFVTPPLFTVGFHLPGKPMAVVPDGLATLAPGEEATTAELDRHRLPTVSEQTIAHPDPGVNAPQVTKRKEIHWLIVLAGLWCVGIVGIAIWQAFRIFRFGRLLRAAEPAPPDVLRIAGEAAKPLGLRRIPAIRMLPVRVSPMIWIIGLKPQVLLPMELFRRLEPAAQSSLLAHEPAHMRRRDHLVRLLQLLISTLFWWHPVVWWACRELQQLEELCCDAMVVGLVPSSRKAYAIALMDTLDFLCDGFIAPPLGATAAKSSALLARRIAMMKNGSGVMRLTLGRLLLLVLVAAIPMSIAFAAKPPKGDGSNSSADANRQDGTATTPEEELKNRLLAGLRKHLEHVQSGIVNLEVRDDKAVIEKHFVAFDNKADKLRSDVGDGNQAVKVIRTGSEYMRFIGGENRGNLTRYKVDDPITMALSGMPVDVRAIGYCVYQTITMGTAKDLMRTLGKGSFVSASLDKDSGVGVINFMVCETPEVHAVTWIDTHNDYVPVRSDIYFYLPEKPPIVHQRTETSWAKVNKAVVPVKSTCRIIQLPGGGADTVREVRLTWKSVNEPVPEKLFSQEDLKLPNGTYIVDARSGKPILEQVTGRKPPSVPPLPLAPKDH